MESFSCRTCLAAVYILPNGRIKVVESPAASFEKWKKQRDKEGREPRKLGSIGPFADLSEDERKKLDKAVKKGEAYVQDCLLCGSKDTIQLLDWKDWGIPDSGPLKGIYVSFDLCESHRDSNKAEIQEALKKVDPDQMGFLRDKQHDISYGPNTTTREAVALIERKAEKLRKDFPTATIEEVASFLVRDTEIQDSKNFVRVVLESLQWYDGWPLADGEGT